MSSDYLTQTFSLAGKTAIITGATGGLGLAMATALAQAGASIVSIELPDDPASPLLRRTIEKYGNGLQTFHCNLEDVTILRSCYQSMWEANIVPDILVNCAATMRRDLCVDTKDEDIDVLVQVNIKAVYASTQEFGRRVLSLGRTGKVVNIASVTSFQAGFNTSMYSATKGAVLQMTKAFSNEWASEGIQVNSIAPGYMQTPMTAAYRAEDSTMTEYLMGRTPMGRWGKPQDMEAAILFLTSPANTFVSGVCIPVDGGFLAK